MKKTLASILFVFAVYTAFSQQPVNGNKQYTGIAIFDTTVAFHDFTIQTNGTDTLYTITSGSNSTLSHGNGSLLLNTSKATIGNFGTTGYKVAATSGNIQMQQGSNDSCTITYTNDTMKFNATVAAYEFTPPLQPNSVSGFWKTTGNAGTDTATNYIGVTDSADFYIGSSNELRTNYSIYFQPTQRNIFLFAGDNNGNGTIFTAVKDGYSSWNFANNNGSNVGYIDLYPDSVNVQFSSNGFLNVYGQLKLADGTQGSGKGITSDANGLASWTATSTTEADSATIYALTPSNGTQYYCTDCTGNGITGRIVAFIAAAWRRLLFED